MPAHSWLSFLSWPPFMCFLGRQRLQLAAYELVGLGLAWLLHLHLAISFRLCRPLGLGLLSQKDMLWPLPLYQPHHSLGVWTWLIQSYTTEYFGERFYPCNPGEQTHLLFLPKLDSNYCDSLLAAKATYVSPQTCKYNNNSTKPTAFTSIDGLNYIRIMQNLTTVRSKKKKTIYFTSSSSQHVAELSDFQLDHVCFGTGGSIV